MADRYAGKSYEEIFIIRVTGIYQNQRRRAKSYNQALDYTLDDLKQLARNFIGRPCRYCGFAVTEDNFTFDHMTPVSKGGSFSIENLSVPCDTCNKAKGSLHHDAFVLLLNALKDMEVVQPGAMKDVLVRLKMGGSFKSFGAARRAGFFGGRR